MSYAICDEPVKLFDPWDGDFFPDDVIHALNDGMPFGAHNAGFEWCIWNFLLAPRWGLPKLPIEQMDCTAVRAAIMALPRDLAGASRALGLDVQKDDEGKRLMQQMAKPRKARKGEDPDLIYWHDDREKRVRLGAYCVRDTEVERRLDEVISPISPDERRLWLLDFKTNMKGIQVDVKLAKRAQAVMDVVAQGYDKEMQELTGGAVRSVTEVAKLKEWLESEGATVTGLTKQDVIELLQVYRGSPHIKRALGLRQEAGKSSVAKLVRFIELTHTDGRMRENFLHHGANTGRAAGKGAQLQNLPSRGGLKWHIAEKVMLILLQESDPVVAAMRIELIYGPVPEAISSCLRGHLIAPKGKRLFVADFSNIEGRVAAWLGGEDWKIAAFIDYDTIMREADGTVILDAKGEPLRRGPDLYKVTAGQILGKPPTDVNGTERNVMGKVPELALGFGGGVGAFVSMGNIYGVNMADYWDIIQESMHGKYLSQAAKNWDRFGKNSGMPEAEWLASETVKVAWRARHPGITACWYDAEEAAIKALEQPGKWHEFADGKLAFGCRRYNGIPFLIGRLPNGRRIYRANAKIKDVKKFGKMSKEIWFQTVDGVTKQWIWTNTYGGDLFQSFVQGIARDIMMNGWVNVDADGFDVVLQVHDELGAEGDEDRTLEEFEAGMIRLPPWAKGCPVSAAGYTAQRYRKD
ncbi:DNA polymerase [Pseudomonas phage PspYZU01]|uniref:DNA-directed DNA polymerase family A palm domain-containing protein n=1 Tax=Pseudomonas phage PspYZU01 TaxID=1983555 RepID=A0A2U7N2B3_9CAUD|nr:DNA polymerase [Pseudomonas phage PspYZU01]ASD51940.1 hypothetical protein PspYZU01_55 [Pseudomonas phage PspYZU01]